MRSLGGVADSLKEQLIANYQKADISETDRLILAFADKLTRSPAKIESDDIRTMREAGFDDQALHDIVQVAAYFNYVNRLADGLGVQLEE